MTTATMTRRTSALDARSRQRAIERTRHRIAAALGIAPELLRAEAITLQRRFAEAGIVSETAQIALVASELNSTLEDLTRGFVEAVAAW